MELYAYAILYNILNEMSQKRKKKKNQFTFVYMGDFFIKKNILVGCFPNGASALIAYNGTFHLSCKGCA